MSNLTLDVLSILDVQKAKYRSQRRTDLYYNLYVNNISITEISLSRNLKMEYRLKIKKNVVTNYNYKNSYLLQRKTI